MTGVPTSVLADALHAQIRGATVVSAVFTTFGLEHDFLLDEVLPTLVPHTLSNLPVLRRDELADSLHQSQTAITVFADAAQIVAGSGSSRIPVAIVPVVHPTGVFHPKVTLLLLQDDNGAERLVAAVGSANLTRAGWWENVECAHVWAVKDGSSTWCRDEVISFLDFLLRKPMTTGRKAALAVRHFLIRTTQRVKRTDASRTDPRFYWNGSSGRVEFAKWLYQQGVTSGDATRLEIISPWYSPTGQVQVRAVADAVRARTVRVALPRNPDESALVTQASFDAVADIGTWSALPISLTKGGEKKAIARRVHAKAYRVSEPDAGYHDIVVGSINLTPPAFAAGGNVEAAVLVGVLDGGAQLWLEDAEQPRSFASEDELESDDVAADGKILAPVRVVVDWDPRTATVASTAKPAATTIVLMDGATKVCSVRLRDGKAQVSRAAADALLTHLVSSSPVLDVVADGTGVGYTIVEEMHIEQKPMSDTERTLADAVADLLLDGDARRARTGVLRGEDEDPAEGDLVDDENREGRSPYELQAALFQAMAAFERELRRLSGDGAEREIHLRLVGGGSRSVNDLLDRARSTAPTSAADALLVTWVLGTLLTTCSGFLPKRHRPDIAKAVAATAALREVLEKQLIDGSTDPEMAHFLRWARSTLTEAAS